MTVASVPVPPDLHNSRKTVRLCYLGMVVLALVINLTPPLFIPLRERLGLSFEQLGRLILVNFATQVFFDLLCGAVVDRLSVRRLAAAANLLVFCGLCLMASAEWLFAVPYHGLLLGTMVFAMGGGMLELLLSPIVNAMPSERKAADMSLLHSFYAIGQLLVILLTVLAVFWLGPGRWWWIVLAWTPLPLLGALGFSAVHIPPFVEASQRHRLRDLVRQRFYLMAVVAIGLAGATELVMSQWVSAYAEKGLGFPKLMGDLLGLCLFAVALGVGRIWIGLRGQQTCTYRLMIAGCWLAVGVYLVACLSPWPWMALAACVLAGFAVSGLWPGMLSVTAQRFPLAGGSMFAIMSASGDVGGALVPWSVGALADRLAGLGFVVRWAQWLGLPVEPDQLGLRAGLLLAAVCPAAMLGLLYWLRRRASAS